MKKILCTFLAAMIAGATLFSINSMAAIDLEKYHVTTYPAPSYFSPEIMAPVGTIWTYEYSVNYDTDFQPMIKNLGLYASDETIDGEKSAELFCPWKTDLYLKPGIKDNNSINAVQTFNVTEDGYLTIRGCDIVRHYGTEDKGDDALQDCEVALFLNQQKIWPQTDGWQKISATAGNGQQKQNVVSMPAFEEMQVKAGDKIRFVVGVGTKTYMNWNDPVQWYATMDMYTEGPTETSQPTTSTSSQQSSETQDNSVASNNSSESSDPTVGTVKDTDSSAKNENNVALIVVVCVEGVFIIGLAVLVVFLYTGKIKGKDTASLDDNPKE